MSDQDRLRRVARRLRNLVEPLAANVYFAPEVHEAYVALGFDGSAATVDGVALPDPVAYFTSRGACLGHVPGEVVAAAFGVFDPAVVVPAVTEGWRRTDRDSILEARRRGATASLQRLLGPGPPALEWATTVLRRAAEAAGGEGRHLFSGLRSLGYPGDPVGDLWRAADLVREHRGDSHIAAWTAAGLDPVEIGLLTELWWGLPLKTYVVSRGWAEDDLDAGIERLRSRGLITGDGFTDEGRRLRTDVEVATDGQERRLVGAIGDDAEELLTVLQPWATAVVAAHGYPAQPGTIGRRPR